MLEREIIEVAQDVWESLCGVRLTPGSTVDIPSPSLTSIVHIDGAWHGAVTVRCAVELAASLTARLFGSSTDADVADLFGELANQLGGNLKALLPAPSSLSLPTVALGADYDVRVMRTRVVASVGFDCDGQPLVLSLLEVVT